MARSLVLAVVKLVSVVLGGAGCHATRSPELRVLGVHDEPLQDIVFVQVTNPARHAMRLTRLQYRFAADGTTVSAGDMALARAAWGLTRLLSWLAAAGTTVSAETWRWRAKFPQARPWWSRSRSRARRKSR